MIDKKRGDGRGSIFLVPAAIAVACCGIALQFLSYPASVLATVAAWVAILLSPWALPTLHASRRIPFFVICALLVFWFSGFNTPYHWDAVQTAIRAQAFWNTGTLERVSPFYVVLSPVVTAFSDTSVPAHIFVMLMGLITLGAIGFIGGKIAGRTWGFYIALIASILPLCFLLYRWVLLDTFFLLMWVLTLAAVFAWSRKLNFWKLIVLLILTGLTVASKEMGAMILFPVGTGLIVLAPREKRKGRMLIVLAVVAVVVPVALFSIVRWAKLQSTHNFFRGVLDSGRGLTFIPFNPDLPDSWVPFFRTVVKHYIAFWAQMGLLVPAVFALWRPRIRLGGWILAGTGAACQVAWMLISRADRWTDIYTFPFFDGHMKKFGFIPFAVFFLVVILLWAVRVIRLRIDRYSWVLLAAIIPGSLFLLMFMKSSIGRDGSVTGWLQWNYPVVLMSGGVLLAAKGLRNAARYKLPQPLLGFCLMALMAFLMNALLHGTGMATRFRLVDLAHQKAYEWMCTQPERIVYTHWPLIYESPGYRYSNYNNGGLAWQRDGWKVMNIRPFSNPAHQGKPGSFVMFDVFNSYLDFSKRLEKTGERAHSESVDYWRMGLFNIKPKITNQKAVIVRRFPSQ